MFLRSLIEELCIKEENNKAGCTLTFGGRVIIVDTNMRILNFKNRLNFDLEAFEFGDKL